MSDPVIRLMALGDLAAALTLSNAAGWNQRPADWRMLLALAPGGSFAAICDGRVAGTSVAIDYGGFAWIAMMLVDPNYRRRGIGRRLLEAAMGAVPRDRAVRLDATPTGRTLYQEYGFDDEATLTRHVADVATADTLAPAAPHNLRRLIAADLEAVAEHDRRIFGGDRRALLDWALEDAPQYARVVESDAAPIHYCLGRRGRVFDQIGPVVAGDDATARALVTAALLGTAGQTVAIDVFDSRSEFARWLRGCGFRAERPLFRMRRRGDVRFPNTDDSSLSPRFEYAILGPEFA